MTQDILIAVALFAMVMSITPGPNNLMLLASGVNFGFRATVPHMLGITVGFFILILAIGFGLAEIFLQLPWTYSALKWAGAVYLLYLAWRIARSGPPEDSNTHSTKPLSFLGAAAFQWVNPKAWVMVVSTFSIYVPAASGAMVILGVAIVFALTCVPSVAIWTLFGSGLRRLLKVRRNLLIFNYCMAVALVLSLYPLLNAF